MSRIEELIKEKCPDGVEYKRLKSVCTEVIVPMRDRPKIFDGEIPWCRIEDIEGMYFNESLSGLKVSEEVIKEMNLKVFPTGTVICSCSASIGVYAINTQPLITNQTFIGLVCGDEIFNKFLLYYMETQTKTLLKLATTGTIPYISRNKFEDLEIPVPPIEIQQEIVRILDKFTELEAELQVELAARKKQYEYMLENILLLTDTEEYTLEEVFEMKNGYTPSKNNEEFWVDGSIDWFRMEDIRANGRHLNDSIQKVTSKAVKKSGLFKANSIALSTSATIGEHALLEVDCLTNQRFTVFTPKKEFESVVNMEYMNYYFEEIDRWCLKHLNQGNFASVDMDALKKYSFPLPTITEQERIVCILKKFDIICNDFAMGLPAEIHARHKQYEYYRDKLLTFERKVV